MPSQTGSCSANQKRQNGGQCSSPTASSGASTSAPTNSPTTAPTLSTVIITPTGTDASSPPPTDLPTLTTAQSTPAGETCVSTATSTQCALGPHAGMQLFIAVGLVPNVSLTTNQIKRLALRIHTVRPLHLQKPRQPRLLSLRLRVRYMSTYSLIPIASMSSSKLP
jgi:hypothetical protein